jgi:hypothetical protein
MQAIGERIKRKRTIRESAACPGATLLRGAARARANHREPARWHDTCLAWWEGDVMEGVAARLVAIGPRSAIVVAPKAPPAPRALRFWLEGYEGAGWLRARVAERSVDRRGLTRVRLIFLPEPCPPEMLRAAVRGFE